MTVRTLDRAQYRVEAAAAVEEARLHFPLVDIRLDGNGAGIHVHAGRVEAQVTPWHARSDGRGSVGFRVPTIPGSARHVHEARATLDALARVIDAGAWLEERLADIELEMRPLARGGVGPSWHNVVGAEACAEVGRRGR